MIDVTKPLELADGTPVTFLNEWDGGAFKVLLGDGEYPRGTTWWYETTGYCRGLPSFPRLRNKAPETFYVVMSLPKKRMTYEEALAEAEAVAKKNPGQTQVIAAAVATSVTEPSVLTTRL